jgi:hypothetical protein
MKRRTEKQLNKVCAAVHADIQRGMIKSHAFAKHKLVGGVYERWVKAKSHAAEAHLAPGANANDTNISSMISVASRLSDVIEAIAALKAEQETLKNALLKLLG